MQGPVASAEGTGDGAYNEWRTFADASDELPATDGATAGLRGMGGKVGGSRGVGGAGEDWVQAVSGAGVS